MDSKYSNYLEKEDNIILKTERRLIISKNEENDKKDKSDEEYWDYEDGGQTMEELDRLEQLELRIERLLNFYSRFYNQKFVNILFNKWKTITKTKNEIIIEDIPNFPDEISIEQILMNNPLKKEIEYPFIIKDWILEDNIYLINKRPKKKFEKINIINQLSLSKEGINIYSPDYSYNNNSNINKKLIPDLLSLNKELPLIKIKRKEKIIDIEPLIKEMENNYKIIKPNKPIRRSNSNIFSNKIIKDTVNNDINDINDKLNEKINEINFNKKYNKYKYKNINEKIEEKKDLIIEKDYYNKIVYNKNQKDKNKYAKIINVDYQLYIPTKSLGEQQFNIQNTIVNEKLINNIIHILPIEKISNKDNDIINNIINIPHKINPALNQKPEKIYKIKEIPSENDSETIFNKIRPNNPIIRQVNNTLIFIDNLIDNSDEITKRPKIKLDKINTVDKIKDSNELDLINSDYDYRLNIKENKNDINIINKLDANLQLINISAQDIKQIKKFRNKNKFKILENTNENIINERISSLDKEISFNQNDPNKILKRNIINPLIKEDEINNIENIKNFKPKINKNNINDKIKLEDINISNIISYENNINNNNLKLIPNIIEKNENILLNPIKINLFKFKNKYCLLDEKPQEKKDVNEIQNNYINIKYKNKNIKQNNIPLIFTNYQLTEINNDKKSKNNLNIIDNENIINDEINLENEMILLNNTNNLDAPKYINKYNLKQIPEKIKESNKINLNDNINISIGNNKLNITNYLLSKERQIIHIPKMISFSCDLNPIEIKTPLKKYQYQKKPEEKIAFTIKTDYLIKKYSKNKGILTKIPIINNDYQIYLPKYIKKTKLINNIIENENIINNIINLLEEENLKQLDNIYELFNKPKLNKLSLNQKPEKIKLFKMINIPETNNRINIDQIKLNKPYRRNNLENISLIKDKTFEDLEEIKKKKQILGNKININDKIKLLDAIELFDMKYEIKNKNNNNIIPKINLKNKYSELKPIKFDIKLKLEKQNVQEKHKEIKYIKYKNNNLDINYNNRTIKQSGEISLISTNYQLTEINIDKIRKKNLNIIDNENIMNNKTIFENEMIHLKCTTNFEPPKYMNKYNLNQIPEKIKESNKINLTDKILLSFNLNNHSTNYSLNTNKALKNIPILQLYQTHLNLVKIPPKPLKKINYFEKSLEHKETKTNLDYIIKKPNINKYSQKIELIQTEYKIIIPKKTIPIKTQNIINNENIITNNPISSFLKEEDKLKDCVDLNPFAFPKNVKLNIIQLPEKLKKSKIIDVSNVTEEINQEQLKPNNIIKRKINKENIIIKDELFDDLENLKIVYKKQINKNNIIDNLPISESVLETLNTDYEIENKKKKANKENKYVPKIILNEYEMNTIKFEIKLNLKKINTNEKPKEKKDIKIKVDYYNKKIEHKRLKNEDKLPIMFNDYQLLDFNVSDEKTKNKNNILRGKKSIYKQIINTIDNEHIKNNNWPEETCLIKNNEFENKFILNPINKYLLNQKPEKIPKLLEINNESEEIIIRKTNMCNPIKKEIKDINLYQDIVNNDLDALKNNKPKKLLNKLNTFDKIIISDNLELNNPDYNQHENKRKINIILNKFSQLNPIEKIKIAKKEKLKLNKNLFDEFEKEDEFKYKNKKSNPDSTLFKFYDSNNKQLSQFNFSSISQNSTNSEAQKQFFDFMHKKYVAFKLFNLKNKHDPRKKWFKIWNMNKKE